MAWPFLYRRVRSYIDAVLVELFETLVFTPRVNVLEVEQALHTALVILPCFVAVSIVCSWSESHDEHNIVCVSPTANFVWVIVTSFLTAAVFRRMNESFAV